MSYYPPGPPTYPSMPFGAVPPEPQPRNRRNLTLILAAIVAVLALVFASVVVIVLKNKKGEFHIPFLSLTSADAPGDAPFMAQPNLTNKPLDNGLRLSAQTARRIRARDWSAAPRRACTSVGLPPVTRPVWVISSRNTPPRRRRGRVSTGSARRPSPTTSTP